MLENLEQINIILIAFTMFLFVLFIYLVYCIAEIKNQLKLFVDLEYKKYKEDNAKNTISSQPGSDRPQQ